MYTIEEMSEVLNMNEAVLLNHVHNLLPLEDDVFKSEYFKRKDGEWVITFRGALYLIASFAKDKGITACLDRFERMFLLKNGIWGI